MIRQSDLRSQFRGLGIHGVACPRRQSFLNVTHRDMVQRQQPLPGSQGSGVVSLAAQVAKPLLELGKEKAKAKAIELAKKHGPKLASNLLFGPVGTKISNSLAKRFGKNPDQRPGFPGEKHVVLPTKHGLARANYAGPGTQVLKRALRGDKGVDGPRGVDSAAKRHDLAYVNARTVADIRKADNRMIQDVRGSTAGPATKAIVNAALRGKKLGEDLKLFNVNTFTQVIEDDQVGGGPPKLPADRLLQRTLRKFGTQKRKRDVSMTDISIKKLTQAIKRARVA